MCVRVSQSACVSVSQSVGSVCESQSVSRVCVRVSQSVVSQCV